MKYTSETMRKRYLFGVQALSYLLKGNSIPSLYFTNAFFSCIMQSSCWGNCNWSLTTVQYTDDTIMEVLPMMVDNIRVAIENGTFSAEEAAYYIQELKNSTKKFTLKKVTMSRTDSYLDLRYSFNEIPFERIRRIPLARVHEERAVNN